MPRRISRVNDYGRRRYALWKLVKSGMITWDTYHAKRAKLDAAFVDVRDEYEELKRQDKRFR